MGHDIALLACCGVFVACVIYLIVRGVKKRKVKKMIKERQAQAQEQAKIQ